MRLIQISPHNYFNNLKIMKIKSLSRRFDKFRHKSMTSEEVFADIYRRNYWDGKESRSGLGSDLNATEPIRQELPLLFKELNILSILDIPCGDFWWLKEIDLSFLSYAGGDIVDDILQQNNKKYKNENRNFVKLDVTKDNLPTVDLVFCRDLFIHLPVNDIIKSIKNIKKSGSKYLMTNSYEKVQKNNDTKPGGWRPLNLLLPPFSFPKPLKSLNEKPIKKNLDKKLYLWEISDLYLI